MLVVARRQTRKGTELPLPCLWRVELPTLHPVSDVITVHLVHLMHPVGSCLGVCLSRTAKSLHSIFHIAECFCLPTGTTGSAVICIYLCSDSKQRIALTDYDKAAIIFLEHTGFIIHISLSFIVRNKIPKSLFFDNIVTYSASEKISKKLELFLLFIFLFPEIYSFKNIFKNHITSLKCHFSFSLLNFLKENLELLNDFILSILFPNFHFLSPSNYQR